MRKARQTEERRKHLTDPEFLRHLRDKANQYHSQDGGRLSKAKVNDPLFKSIQYCRRRFRQAEVIEEFKSLPTSANDSSFGGSKIMRTAIERVLANPPESWLKPYDPMPEKSLAKEFISAVKRGDIPRLKAIVKFCETIEQTICSPGDSDRKRNSRCLHYYVATVAHSLLVQRHIPTKKELKERTMARLLWDQFPVLETPDEEWKQKFEAGIERLSHLIKPNWARIFRDLGLSDLPAAPTHDAST